MATKYGLRQKGKRARGQYEDASRSSAFANAMDPGVRPLTPPGMNAQIKGIRKYAEKQHTAQAYGILQDQQKRAEALANQQYMRGLQQQQIANTQKQRDWDNRFRTEGREYNQYKDYQAGVAGDQARYQAAKEREQRGYVDYQKGVAADQQNYEKRLRNQAADEMNKKRFGLQERQVANQERLTAARLAGGGVRGIGSSKKQIMPSKAPDYYEKIFTRINPEAQALLGETVDGKYNPSPEGRALISAMDIVKTENPNIGEEDLVREAARRVGLPTDPLETLKQRLAVAEEAAKDKTGYSSIFPNSSDYNKRQKTVEDLRAKIELAKMSGKRPAITEATRLRAGETPPSSGGLRPAAQGQPTYRPDVDWQDVAILQQNSTQRPSSQRPLVPQSPQPAPSPQSGINQNLPYAALTKEMANPDGEKIPLSTMAKGYYGGLTFPGQATNLGYYLSGGQSAEKRSDKLGILSGALAATSKLPPDQAIKIKKAIGGANNLLNKDRTEQEDKDLAVILEELKKYK